jgi:hypothetical protein
MGAFALQRDWLYVRVTVIVFSVLVYSLLGKDMPEAWTSTRPERPALSRVFFVRAWRPDLFLRPLRPPGCPDLGQEVDIEVIGQDQLRMGLPGC